MSAVPDDTMGGQIQTALMRPEGASRTAAAGLLAADAAPSTVNDPALVYRLVSVSAGTAETAGLRLHGAT